MSMPKSYGVEHCGLLLPLLGYIASFKMKGYDEKREMI